MKKIFFSIFLVLNAIVSYAIQQKLQPLPMDPDLKYGILDNGLTYYIRHNETEKQRADFYIVQNVGAILEEDSQNGLAHFLEHIAFNGTKNFPDKGIINYLETIGVKFGANINAYTSLDETVYNLKAVPTYRSGIVDSCLLILHDWSSFISCEDDEIDKERGVILEEWRTRNTADRRMWKESSAILYEGSQYAKRDIIGDTSIIKNFHPDSLRAYYNKWYRPDLQGIIIVGDVDANYVETKIKEMFADIPARVNPAPREIYQLKPLDTTKVCILTDPENKYTMGEITFRHDPMPEEAYASIVGYATSIIDRLIHNMVEERIEDVVKENNSPFNHAAISYHNIIKSCDAFELAYIVKDNRCMEASERIISLTEQIRRYGFLESELYRAKETMTASFEKAYAERSKAKNNSFVGEYKRNFTSFEPIPGIEWEYDAVKKILSTVTTEVVNKRFADYFNTNQVTVLMTAPEKDKAMLPNEKQLMELIANREKIATSQFIDKTKNSPLIKKEPKRGSVVDVYHNPKLDYTQWTLSNGAKVIIKSTNLKNDEILMTASSDGGLSTINDLSKLSSGRIADNIIEANGLGDFDATQLGKALAGKNVAIAPQIAMYDCKISGRSTVKDFKTMLQLSYLYQTAARKDPKAYKSLMSQYETILKNRSADPMNDYRDSIQVLSSGKNSYTKPFKAESLAEVKEADAIKFYKSLFYSPEKFTYIFVGNLNEDSVKNDILSYIGGIKPSKSKQKGWIDRGIKHPSGHTKSEFSKTLSVPKSADYFSYMTDFDYNLKNKQTLSILRSVLDYRYLESCREKEGGTYGVAVRQNIYTVPDSVAILKIAFDTDPDKEELLSRLIKEEIDKIIAEGPRADDFQKAKEALQKSFAENILENGYWCAQLDHLVRYGWCDNQTYTETLAKITSEDVRLMLKSIMDAGNLLEIKMKPMK
ncbi:MAG: insulinase family protein [Paludibacteraceae bacterium]|nr:insulinase family protein [Paludibacteraceae bacterium]